MKLHRGREILHKALADLGKRDYWRSTPEQELLASVQRIGDDVRRMISEGIRRR